MYQSISFLKLWSILATLIIMLLQGCATDPYNTAPHKKTSNTNIHLVRQGETLSNIAIRYNMDLKTLAALNNIPASYSIKPGQKIRVYASSSNSSKAFPISTSSMSPPKKTYQYGRKSYNATVTQKGKKSYRMGTQKGIYHTVKPNETLYGISKRYGKNYLNVARWNGIPRPYQLKVGQRLHLAPPRQKKHTPPQYSKAETGSVVDNQDSMVNNKRPTSHIIQRGDTLYSLARRYGCTIGDIIYWNGLKPPSYLLLQGRRLRVAPPSPANERPKNPSASSVSHIVQSGDTIETIAQHYGYTVEEIARWNGLEPPYDLSGGRRLRIAPPQQTAPPPTSMTYTTSSQRVTTQSSSGFSRSAIYHTVVKGDTLYSLSRRFRRSVADIMAWNHLRSPKNLSVGQRLQVALKGTVSQRTSQTQTVIHHNTGYHTVSRGDTLYSISRTYGYSVPEVAEWNYLQYPYSLSIGQELRVYPPSGINFGGKRGSMSRMPNRYQYQSNVNVNVHVVAKGDTLYSIANRYGKALSQLIRWNKLQPPYTLSIGQRLRLSFSSTNRARGTTNRWSSSSRHHIVRKGDTLVRIAARYGVSPSEVSEWNGMGNPYTIYPGQKLLIAAP
jgi:LysM repeat protein